MLKFGVQMHFFWSKCCRNETFAYLYTKKQTNKQAMMNQFDFHVVEIISSRKTDIYNAADNKDEAKAKIQTKVIRNGRFPRKEYRLTVGYVDAITNNASEKVDAIMNQYKGKGVRVHSRYICR